MHPIIEKAVLSPNVTRLRVVAPRIAELAISVTRPVKVESGKASMEISTESPIPMRTTSVSSTWTVTSTSSGDTVLDTNDDYVVLSPSSASSPEIAFVFSNGTGATRPGTLEWSDSNEWGESYVFPSWGSLTVEPGGKLILMQFLIQADAGSAEGLAVQLRDLTHEKALAGLSAEERASIINFEVP